MRNELIIKSLCTIMNNRLVEYTEISNLINNGQIGFKKSSRTTDHVFTLKSLINKYVYDNKNKLYTCFIDFKKAFDSIWHKGLFNKLEKNNINGKFLDLLKNIYKKSKCAIKINNKLTNFFDFGNGVRQGDPLSPTLFNIFVNDLFQEINSSQTDFVCLNNLDKISALMFADDLILFSTTKEGLQKSLDTLDTYVKKWRLEINYKKTKCMTFSKSNHKEKHIFTIRDKMLDNTNEYKYLGFTINKKGNFTPTLEDLSCKAKRAIYSINSKINIRFLSVKTLLKLFDSLISPILLYGSELWEPYLNQDDEKWDKNSIEKVHLSFMKRLLGLNRSTSNTMVRGDMGRYSLKSLIISRNIKYLTQIKQKSDNTLVKQAYLYEINHSHNRISIENTANKFNDNLKTLLNKEIDIYQLSKYKLKQYILSLYCDKWKNMISNSSKADTYKVFKITPKFEKYFECIKNIKHLKAFTKLRLSDHNLMIEEGRRRRPILPRNERLCNTCNKLEDEIHFLIDCDKYKYERLEKFKTITEEVPNFELMPDSKAKFIFLMTQENEKILNLIASCTHDWFKIGNTPIV
jgi:hypothetical protein